MSNIKRILFVDDESNILNGLRRMLRPMRDQWDMHFAGSGAEALALIEQLPFEVIVSDMRMPEMDGATLLSKVMELSPRTIRFVLSGQSDQETIMRSIGPTHQFLSKPCDPRTLRDAILRAFAIRQTVSNARLEQIITRVDSLPSLPELYQAVTNELRNEQPSIKKIGELISQDPAMTAKILQLVNSSFFGLPRQVDSPAQAVTLLGLATVRSLVLVVKVFDDASHAIDIPGFSISALQYHSVWTATVAQKIAATEGLDAHSVGEAFMAAVLHDMGKLILSQNLPDLYTEAIALSKAANLPMYQAEQEVLGISHPVVGGYLLGLWGFSDPITEAVVFHHKPSESTGSQFAPITAVHMADGLTNRLDENSKLVIDTDYLIQLGLSARVQTWRNLCRLKEG